MITLHSRVKALLPCDGKSSVQYETGLVLYLGRRVLVEFDSEVCGHNGNGLGKPRRCWMMDWDKVEPINEEIKMDTCKDKNSPEEKQKMRAIYHVYAVKKDADEIVFEQKVVAESEKDALYESDLKEALKKKEISKDDIFTVCSFVGEVPAKEKVQKVSVVEKVFKSLTGQN